MSTRYDNNLHIPSIRLAAIQRGSTYSAIKIFNKFPPSISGLKNDKTIFNSALKEYNPTYVFHSMEEFLSKD